MVDVGELRASVLLQGDQHPAVLLAEETEQCFPVRFDSRHAQGNVRAGRRIPVPIPSRGDVTSVGPRYVLPVNVRFPGRRRSPAIVRAAADLADSLGCPGGKSPVERGGAP
ncbi:hypothetical protein GCM10027028_16390 [Streptomyces sundarbansensis]